MIDEYDVCDDLDGAEDFADAGEQDNQQGAPQDARAQLQGGDKTVVTGDAGTGEA